MTPHMMLAPLLLGCCCWATTAAPLAADGPPPPPPPSPCEAALDKACGAARAACTTFPCASCQGCIIGAQGALSKAGCQPPEEVAFCAGPAPIPPPPPLSCTHTDSRGDSYDLSGVPHVDGEWKTIDQRHAWYFIGICSAPTQSATDPTKGCLPGCPHTCAWDEGCDDCGANRAVDAGGEAVCQYDGDPTPPASKQVIQYNLGMLKSGEQRWSDGPTPGKSVQLTYEGGSMRGGCEDVNRSTTIVVTCDPCSAHNISNVKEISKCHYQVTVNSVAGCATNRPPPSASCPHVCDHTTFQCKPAAAGTPGANATLGDCTKSCKKAPPPPPPP